MPNKIYMVTVDESRFTQTDPPSYVGGDIFYVRAENDKLARDIVSEAVKKYYFKAKLSNGNTATDNPGRLGENIIVEQWVTEATGDAPLEAIDVTAMAYMWSAEGKKYWVDWNITVEDVRA